MIYFDLSSKKNVIEDHYKLLEKELKYKAEGSTLSKKQKKFITDNLESILTKKPSDLLQLETRFKTLGKKKNTNAQLKTIFNYNKFIIKNARKYDAYDLANKLGVRVCLYCNRMYTLTIQTSSKKEDHIIRPEFDHFFNKDKHPLLGLSIYNLIPSCSICNSTLKGQIKFDPATHIHPYIDDCLSCYKYSFKPYDVESVLGCKSNLEIQIISNTSSPLSTKIDATAKVFKLESIFNGHTEELKDLFDIRYRFSETYLKQLASIYNIGISHEEVYKIAFGVHSSEDEFGKRPFSKIKKDILTELGVLQQ